MKYTKIERCQYCGSSSDGWPFGGCACWTEDDA